MGLEALRVQIKAASYTGVFGRQLDVVFSRFDKDSSGELEDDEVRQALRRVLKIPPSIVSDAQISSLCAALDSDNSGSVSIQELIDFVGPESDISHRTGHKIQSMSHQALEMLDDDGPFETTQKLKESSEMPSNSMLPAVSPGRPMTSRGPSTNVEAVPASQGRPRPDFPAQDPLLPQVLPNLAG